MKSAITEGKTVKRFNRKGGYHISGWQSPDDFVKWNLKVSSPGNYKVSIKYASLPSWAGQGFKVSVGGKSLEAETLGTGDWYEYAGFDLGTVNLGEGEAVTLEVRPEGQVRQNLMYFKEILLEPEAGQ